MFKKYLDDSINTIVYLNNLLVFKSFNNKTKKNVDKKEDKNSEKKMVLGLPFYEIG